MLSSFFQCATPFLHQSRLLIFFFVIYFLFFQISSRLPAFYLNDTTFISLLMLHTRTINHQTQPNRLFVETFFKIKHFNNVFSSFSIYIYRLSFNITFQLNSNQSDTHSQLYKIESSTFSPFYSFYSFSFLSLVLLLLHVYVKNA